ncbi:hypothetical protein HMPREF1246_0832 [Acidaminococcus sp. BV3L6]|jgi:hypothetical protein|nr:hypothetical protein HMPREF1246_0832 [Acidaminococcus sp. BV3L6]
MRRRAKIAFLIHSLLLQASLFGGYPCLGKAERPEIKTIVKLKTMKQVLNRI